ncbi:MAG: SGNH/GDSL hydrolase family protein [Abditibacteriaceae bacterium]
MTNFLLKDGQTVVFAGDSITDCGRRDSESPFGNGYVRHAIDLITARYPSLKLKYFNEGIGGNTVVDLQNRWEDDVLRHKPDWITVKIGINDLHRGWALPTEAVTPEIFEVAYRDILTRSKAAGAKLLLIDPFYLSQDQCENSFRKKVLDALPEYISVVNKMATEFDALHVKTHDLYQDQLQYRAVDYFCPEPVHPYTSGHHVISLGLLDALNW